MRFFAFFLQFLDTVKTVIPDFSNLSKEIQVNQLLFGSVSYNFNEYNTILNASVTYILDTNRFSGPLI